MKFWTFSASVCVAMLLSQSEVAQAASLNTLSQIEEAKLDESTKKQVKKAAAAALKVAVAAKKAESSEAIKKDMEEVNKAESKEQSDAITEAVDKTSQEEEKKAVEKAVAHVERIRQQKIKVHNAALKEIDQIKADAQKKHDEINKQTTDATKKIIAKAQSGVTGLDAQK